MGWGAAGGSGRRWGGMGTCPGCVTSYEVLGGTRLWHSPPATLVPLGDLRVGQKPLSLVSQGRGWPGSTWSLQGLVCLLGSTRRPCVGTFCLAHEGGTYLLLSARFKCLLMSSSTSLRKLSLFSSNCWHCSKTCSMLSMYCGVHLFSSSSTFSYFS